MSLKRNILANYASQLYVTGVGILILPLYIQYMGAEAYGLVGFFTMLQAWFSLLDMGLTPTIGRETARYHGGSMTALAYRQLFRALSLIFASIAVIGSGALWFFAEVVATSWLNVNELEPGEVVLAVQIMAISVALRWMGGLYRGVITGSERLVWLSGFNVLIATLRFIAVFASMWLYGFTPFIFFVHQLVVALLEVAGLFMMSNRLLPSQQNLSGYIGWSFKPVKPVLKFALTIAFTSSVWVLVTQTDKLVLSGILPLAEYGYFTLAVLAGSGVMVISAPISSAILPRLVRLHSENKKSEFNGVYCGATYTVTLISFTAAMVIALYAKPLVYAWTGDLILASNTAPILRLYVLGNGFLALAAFPGYLQNAFGDLKYHLIGSILIVCTLIPASIFFAINYGAVGAGWVWFFLNLMYLVFWVAYSHHKLIPGEHFKWLIEGVLKPFAPSVLVLLCADLFFDISAGRVFIVFDVFIVYVACVLSAAICCSKVRSFIVFFIKRI